MLARSKSEEQLQHGAEFKVKNADEYLQVGRDVMQQGQRVEYAYMGATRTGYVQFLGNTRSGEAKQIVGTFAEFERAMLRERTLTGLDAARKQGRIGGRRPTLRTHQQDEVIHLVISGQKTAADAARLFNVHPATISRLLKRHRPGT